MTKEKTQKRNLIEQQNSIKPGECLKSIKIIIDPQILNHLSGSQISQYLEQLNVKIELECQQFPGIISWKRLTQQNPDELRNTVAESTEENTQLIVMQAEDYLDNMVPSRRLISKLENSSINFMKTKIVLLIFGLKEYFRLNPKRNKGKIWLETELTQLQLQPTAQISHRLVETSADLANTISQFTKSISEIPYKKQKYEQLKNQNFYVVNDNRDCVTVKGSIGFKKLWQHHLIKMPLVTLDIAETIIKEYPMPRLLINAYKNNATNGPELLENMPVCRGGGGPIKSSTRKIGPELSKKFHLFYTSNDPDQIL